MHYPLHVFSTHNYDFILSCSDVGPIHSCNFHFYAVVYYITVTKSIDHSTVDKDLL